MCVATGPGTIGRLVYYFDTKQKTDRARLEAQGALWDPFTFRTLDEAGVSEGWRCLEVGAGTGSVAGWLRDRVGTRGHVVATDIETRWLEPLAGPNLEVRRHDVTADPLEPSAYDLIHLRLVLMHLPERDAVIAKLVAALRPGGRLVVHDYDVHTAAIAHPPDAIWTKVSHACFDVLRSAGADVAFGRTVATALERSGLTNVRAEGLVLPRPAPELAGVLLPILERMRHALLAGGDVSEAELEHAIAQLGDGSALSIYSPILVSARGQRTGRTT
jgi:ubiquinone/menaquinone biosynthesis C-methylase UbiE